MLCASFLTNQNTTELLRRSSRFFDTALLNKCLIPATNQGARNEKGLEREFAQTRELDIPEAFNPASVTDILLTQLCGPLFSGRSFCRP